MDKIDSQKCLHCDCRAMELFRLADALETGKITPDEFRQKVMEYRDRRRNRPALLESH